MSRGERRDRRLDIVGLGKCGTLNSESWIPCQRKRKAQSGPKKYVRLPRHLDCAKSIKGEVGRSAQGCYRGSARHLARQPQRTSVVSSGTRGRTDQCALNQPLGPVLHQMRPGSTKLPGGESHGPDIGRTCIPRYGYGAFNVNINYFQLARQLHTATAQSSHFLSSILLLQLQQLPLDAATIELTSPPQTEPRPIAKTQASKRPSVPRCARCKRITIRERHARPKTDWMGFYSFPERDTFPPCLRRKQPKRD